VQKVAAILAAALELPLNVAVNLTASFQLAANRTLAAKCCR
jgi:hypothetical protein